MQGIYCKTLSLGNGQFTGKTLSVSFQNLKKNDNAPGYRIGDITLRDESLALLAN